MSIKILLFGGLKEAMNQSEYSFDIKNSLSAIDLFNRVFSDHPNIIKAYKDSTLFAVNQEHSNKETLINDGDEVAFMPPMAGG